MGRHSRSGYLLKNTLILALGDLGTKLISFFLVPLYTNVLTTGQYGTTDFVQTLATVLLPLLTCNIAESILRFSMDKDAEHDKIMSVSLVILLFSAVAGLTVIPLARLFPLIGAYGPLAYLYVLSLVCYQAVTCFLRGQEALVWYSVTSILHSFAIAVFNILFLVVFRSGVAGYLLAFALGNFLCAGFGILAGRLYRHFRHFQWDPVLAGRMLRFSIALIPTSLLWWVCNAADHIMVTALAGAAANGIYAVSYKIPTILASVAGIFNRAWTYSSVQEADSRDVAAYTNQVFDRFVSVVTLAAGGFLLILKPFLFYYVAPEFYTAWKSAPFLILGYVFHALSTFLVTQYITKKDSRGLLVSAAVGAFPNIALNIPCILLWGAPGAALGTAVSHLAMFLYAAYDTRKYVPLHFLTRKNAVTFCLLLAMCAGLFWESLWGQGLVLAAFLLLLLYNRQLLSLLLSGLKQGLRRFQ